MLYSKSYTCTITMKLYLFIKDMVKGFFVFILGYFCISY